MRLAASLFLNFQNQKIMKGEGWPFMRSTIAALLKVLCFCCAVVVSFHQSPTVAQFRLSGLSLPNSNTVRLELAGLPTNARPVLLLSTNTTLSAANWSPIFTGRVGQTAFNLPKRTNHVGVFQARYDLVSPTEVTPYTNFSFESFEGIGVINSNAPGGLGTVSLGALYKRGVGPRYVEEDVHGWSGELREPFVSYFDLTNPKFMAATNAGAFGFWVRFSDFGTATFPNHFAQVARITTGADSSLVTVGINKSGLLYVVDTGATATPINLRLHQWYYFLLEYQNVSPTMVSYRLSIKPLGGPLQIIRDRPNFNPGSLRQFQRICLVDQQNGSGGIWYGRVGAVGLYPINEIGQGDVGPEALEPIEMRRNWYVNPATGNDNNTGLAPDQAWATAEKLSNELTYSGIMGSAYPWRRTDGSLFPTNSEKKEFLAALQNDSLVPNGDTVLIDTTLAPLNVSTQITVGVRVPGAHVTSYNAEKAELSCFKPISPQEWSKTEGYEFIYQSTNAEAFCVLWEDRKWMNHATGNVFSAAANFLNSTPGSFWTDGRTLYVHSFDSTDPQSNGRAYERSRLLGNVANHGMTVVGHNCKVSRLRIGGTAVVDYSVTDSPANVNHYCLQVYANNNVVEDCYLFYGSKHCYGTLGGSDNKVVYVRDVQSEQASRFVKSGGQTVFVVYASSSTNMSAYFKGCVTLRNQGALGTVDGEVSLNQTAFYSHSTGVGVQWEDVFIDHGHFPMLEIGQRDNAIANGFTITDTHFGSGFFNKAHIERCHIDLLNAVPSAGGRVTVRNSILTPVLPPSLAQFTGRIQGEFTVEGCTIDMSHNTGIGSLGLFNRYAPVRFVYRNNLFIGKVGQNFAVLNLATSDDVLSFDNNCYDLGTVQRVVLNFNDRFSTSHRTLSQWQALGQDLSSFSGQPTLREDYAPLPGSPLIDAGADLGTDTDYSGILHSMRNDIGAFEFVP